MGSASYISNAKGERMSVQQKIETDTEKFRRVPSVLESYARDIEKYGRPLDSGLPALLRFVAEQIRVTQIREEG